MGTTRRRRCRRRGIGSGETGEENDVRQRHSERTSGREGQRIQIATTRQCVEMGRARGLYRAECRTRFGLLKWVDDVDNVVTWAGKNDMETNYLKASAFTQTLYMGLIGNTTWTNLATTISSLNAYTSGTGICAINTAAPHGLNPGDTVIIASATGTGTNFGAVNGTWICQASTT